MISKWLGRIGFALLASISAGSAEAKSLSVAVAANFTRTANEIGTAFRDQTGIDVQFSFGSSGTLFAQIAQGAPFDVFLSADAARPARAVEDGLAVKDSLFTFALGRLALYAPQGMPKEKLVAGNFTHIAIADPQQAPYGTAAIETLKALDLIGKVRGRRVTGANVTQTLQFVESGNAELGFVAFSQVINKPKTTVWIVPAKDYAPITQDAVLLTGAANNPDAEAFIGFLNSPMARSLIEKAGYGVPAQQ